MIDISKEMINLSRCSKEDSEIIAALDKHVECGWSQDVISAALNDTDMVFLKADKDGETIGYVSFRIVLDEAEINNIAVFPAYRRIGCAGRLINEVKDTCRVNGIKNIFLEVNERNIAAQKLYENCGFTRISTRKKYYGEDSAYIYRFSLE